MALHKSKGGFRRKISQDWTRALAFGNKIPDELDLIFPSVKKSDLRAYKHLVSYGHHIGFEILKGIREDKIDHSFVVSPPYKGLADILQDKKAQSWIENSAKLKPVIEGTTKPGLFRIKYE